MTFSIHLASTFFLIAWFIGQSISLNNVVDASGQSFVLMTDVAVMDSIRNSQ